MKFFDSDTDLHVVLGRTLVLIKELSLSTSEKQVLTVERLVIYDFFLKYPTVLIKSLHKLNKKNFFDVKEYEVNSLSSFYPSYSDLYRTKDSKDILQILYSKGLVEIIKENEGEWFVILSSSGESMAIELISPYFDRIREISKAIKTLHSISFASLRDSVNSLLFA